MDPSSFGLKVHMVYKVPGRSRLSLVYELRRWPLFDAKSLRNFHCSFSPRGKIRFHEEDMVTGNLFQDGEIRSCERPVGILICCLV